MTDGKLVRDHIPDLIRQSGRHIEVRSWHIAYEAGGTADERSARLVGIYPTLGRLALAHVRVPVKPWIAVAVKVVAYGGAGATRVGHSSHERCDRAQQEREKACGY
jgi:hypothetical protein